MPGTLRLVLTQSRRGSTVDKKVECLVSDLLSGTQIYDAYLANMLSETVGIYSERSNTLLEKVIVTQNMYSNRKGLLD